MYQDTISSPVDRPAPQLAVVVPSYNERDNIPLLYEKVSEALRDVPFEFIVVDDDSPDGTSAVVKEMSRRFANVRCIRRVGRRGLTSAVAEGICSTSAPYVAVVDGDMQHDERVLPQMYALALAGDDVVVGTRFAGDGSVGYGLSATREKGSRFATTLSALVTGRSLSDPMSGFFLMRRDVFDRIVGSLSKDGFKILLDVIVTATRDQPKDAAPLRIGEVPYVFRPRHAGESKMSPLVVVQFLGLLLSKMTGGRLPTSFLMFAMVGGSGVFVHLAVLWFMHERMDYGFAVSQLTAALVAMTSNFFLNNELTYSDKKLRGGRLWKGLATFYAACSIGTVANISVSSWIYQAGSMEGYAAGQSEPHLYLAGIAGAVMGVVFNYSVTRVFTWR